MHCFEFDRRELLLINILGGRHEDGVGNVICDRVTASVYAEDFDAPINGPAWEGFHVLIIQKDLAAWRTAAESVGATVEEVDVPEDGHYGDSSWAGVDIVSVPNRDSLVYWIERS